ncbi:hypothetical protein GGF46_002068 [Coemansia sp. RSA 552]|nr:hypothetical protein GGF46_002068 [Coemansia sp. RSA 552]
MDGALHCETPVKSATVLLPARDQDLLRVQSEYKTDDWEGFTGWLRRRYDPGGQKFKTAEELLREEIKDPIYPGQIDSKLNNAVSLIRSIDDFTCEEKKAALVLHLKGNMLKHARQIFATHDPTVSFEDFAKDLIARLTHMEASPLVLARVARRIGVTGRMSASISGALDDENVKGSDGEESPRELALIQQMIDLIESLILLVQQQQAAVTAVNTATAGGMSAPKQPRKTFCVYCASKEHFKGGCKLLTTDLRAGRVRLENGLVVWPNGAQVPLNNRQGGMAALVTPTGYSCGLSK